MIVHEIVKASMRFRRLKIHVGAFVLLLASKSIAQQPTEFALHDGDRVVFLGDSITAQRFYTTYLQTAVHARYPEWNIQFYNAGVGGDNVFGGIAGSIDTRLTRDVLDFHPTVVTIMLGMNDRGHADKYEQGYKHILDVLHARAASARIVVLGPTPVDGVTNKNPAANRIISARQSRKELSNTAMG